MAEIKHYFSIPADDRQGVYSRPSTADIIRIAQAMLKLGLYEETINWICGWQPKITEAKHVFEFFSKLLNDEDTEHYDLLLSQKRTGPNKLAVVCACISLGEEPPQNYVEYLLKLFKRLRTISNKRFRICHLLLFAEYILSVKGKEAATELINKFSINKHFSTVPSLYSDEEKQEFLCFPKHYALTHFCKGETIDFDSYWIDGASATSKHLKEYKQSFKQMVDFLLPLCLLRLSCMQPGTDSFAICKDTVQKLERQAWCCSSYNKHQLLETGLLVFSDVLSCAKGLSANHILEVRSCTNRGKSSIMGA